MKKIVIVLLLGYCGRGIAQDSTSTYKKRVLESTEVDFLTSYYSQDGDNAAVTGGIGSEKLNDFTPTIVIAVPLNADDVLTVDAGISAYTSASSSNLNPFDGPYKTGSSGGSTSGASSSVVFDGGGRGDGEGDGEGEGDDEGGGNNNNTGAVEGSPWVATTGASRSDVWANVSVDYTHNSDDRNKIWSAHASVSSEYDYSSFGFGGGYARLFNEKNTELSIKGKIYLDTWNPRYPTELDSYLEVNGNLNQGFFSGVDILNENGAIINKNGPADIVWSPVAGFGLIQDKARNSYSLSLGFSQILSKKAQVSIFMDLVQQKGWLSNPMQRVYFGDRANYYIGNPDYISNYTSPTNTGVFQLADDFERLPDSRFKIPIGVRFNYYLNEVVTLRTYYRYYFDDWGLIAHTANIEIPIKISDKFTLYPSYQYYTQTAIDYFAPYEQNLSTQEFYTSDYDLSEFTANQFGFGISYTDIFTKMHIWNLHLKNIDIRFNHYDRSTGLKANIISGAFKFIVQ